MTEFLVKLQMTEFFSDTACRQLLQMVIAIFFFHISEFVLAIAIHGKDNLMNSLLISQKYLLAMAFSFIEYIIEIYFFPGLKELWWISNTGLGMVVVGETIRKLAIISVGQAFTHFMKTRPTEGHRLVTHGVYQFIRHPCYTGTFTRLVGSQLMLCNPLSTVGFAVFLWRLFRRSILYEEYFLKQFFGMQYGNYARSVPSGIPFIK